MHPALWHLRFQDPSLLKGMTSCYGLSEDRYQSALEDRGRLQTSVCRSAGSVPHTSRNVPLHHCAADPVKIRPESELHHNHLIHVGNRFVNFELAALLAFNFPGFGG